LAADSAITPSPKLTGVNVGGVLGAEILENLLAQRVELAADVVDLVAREMGNGISHESLHQSSRVTAERAAETQSWIISPGSLERRPSRRSSTTPETLRHLQV